MRNITGVVSVVLVVCGCGGGGGGSSSRNLAPLLSAPASLEIQGNAKAQTVVVVGDDRTQPDQLSLSVTSDNLALVPDAGLTLDAAGEERQLEVIPTADEVGSARITVRARDADGLATTVQIRVDVLPVEKGVREFVRNVFVVSEESTPVLLNAVSFTDDAEDDNFADLTN